MVVRQLLLLSLLGVIFLPGQVTAHGGGLAADGCHNDRKNGGRHCHGGGGPTPAPQRIAGGATYFPNCAAARAAGAAPIRMGQPGYGSHLDRDGDGKACE